ncbi:C-type lectin domain family 12 member A isoform X3 [Mesocricetus auratus]|uniref:C-type lectin domain family 12 member A isoform X3 n=1 Tax=Mesocricetus auratus TaxID=10036 RepID=A0ABM2X9Y8_MESAU|nr:C-type lectin domain family 12 member A isoform X3 [Mesocricetus auratus]
MSEEIVYANLKFQDSNKKEHTQRSEKGGAEVPSAPSHSQDKAVLSLTLLCLLLLVGLGVLGGLFYTTLETVIIKSNELQDIKEELQRNVSLQLTHNHNSSKKIRHLSSLLQKLATQLCRELYRKEPEHKCKPCPKGSKWHKDSCYFKLSRLGTWQNSEMLCSTQNASLLKLKNKSVLEFVKSEKLSNFWLGLSPRKDFAKPEKLTETFLSAGTTCPGHFPVRWALPHQTLYMKMPHRLLYWIIL